MCYDKIGLHVHSINKMFYAYCLTHLTRAFLRSYRGQRKISFDLKS